MSFFKREDAHSRARSRVADLLPAANALAISALPGVVKRFPDTLSRVDSKNWDFFATIAAATAAFWILNRKHGVKADTLIDDELGARMEAWDKQFFSAVQDCNGFVNRAFDFDATTYEAFEVNIANSLGMWIMWNLYEREPSFEQAQAGSAIGQMIVQSFRDWWD